MKIKKVYGGYQTQGHGTIETVAPTERGMAKFSLEVLKGEIVAGLGDLNHGEVLEIDVRLAVSRDNPDPGTD